MSCDRSLEKACKNVKTEIWTVYRASSKTEKLHSIQRWMASWNNIGRNVQLIWETVTLRHIFMHQENGHVVCSICHKANAGGDFSSSKKWDEWKLNYLKWHFNHKVHADSVEKLCNKRKGGILKMLTETMQDRQTRIELAECKKTKADQVKVMINSVVLAIKMNASCFLCKT